MRTSVYLVRHGQTVANVQQRYQSSSDSPLTPYGERQAAALGWRLRRIPFGVALISPTGRTRSTALQLLQGRPDTLRQESALWGETNHGRWEGLTYPEVLVRFPDEAHARFADGIHGKAEGGESLHDIAGRIGEAWADILRQHSGGRILVVTHATPIQLVLCATFGLPADQHWHNWFGQFYSDFF